MKYVTYDEFMAVVERQWREPTPPKEWKTPKQFWHWAEKYGFRKARRNVKWYFWNRKINRHMRVLEHRNKLQVGDDNFDRWANSVGFEIDIPSNEKQFIEFMTSCGFSLSNKE